MITNADTVSSGVVDISDQFDLTELDVEYGELEPVGTKRPKGLSERGMVTAEWAIGIITAVSIAGIVLYFLVKGPAKKLLTDLILQIVNHVSAWGLKG